MKLTSMVHSCLLLKQYLNQETDKHNELLANEMKE